MKGRATLFLAVVLLALVAAVAIRGWLARTPSPAAEAPERIASESSSAPSSEIAPDGAREEAVETASAPAERLRVLVLDAVTNLPAPGAQVVQIDNAELVRELEAAGTTIHAPLGRALRARLARTSTTDGSGVVEIEVADRRWMIEARAGERFGFAMLNVLPADRCLTIRLDLDFDVCVRIGDSLGRPLAGVPVALRRKVTDGRNYEAQLTESEAPDGCARFEHYQRRLRQGSGWHFAFGFPVLGDPAATPGAADCASAPLLVLPGAGSIIVHVRGPDGERGDLAELKLALTALDPRTDAELPLWQDGSWSHPRLDASADARVPSIGLGLRVGLELLRDERPIARTIVTGPVRDGEVVECDLVWSRDSIAPRSLVTGRFTFADGRAWPRATVQATPILFPRDDLWPPAQPIEVGDDGRFQVQVRDARPEGGTRAYRLSADHPGGLGQVVALLPLDLDVPAEGLDLGDVVLDHGPLLAAGRVVDERGEPIAGARVWLHAHTVAQGQEFWPRLPASGLELTGTNGEFALHLQRGEPDSGAALRIRAACEGYVTVADRPVARGETGVIFVLRRAGAIEGSLVLDDDLAVPDVILALDGPTKTVANLRDDSKVAFRELAGGTYSLQVRVRSLGGIFDDAVRVDDLVVIPGATCRDPRVQDLRVESPYETIAITVVDHASTPLAHASVSVAGEKTGLQRPSRADGVCRVSVERLPVDLDVTAFGFRTRRVTGVTEDMRVVLDEGIPVRIRAGIPSRGDKPRYQLALLLFEVDESDLQRGLVYGDAFPVERRFFDASGELALRLPAPGVYECYPMVTVPREDHVGSGGGIDIAPMPRITVLESSREQVFELAIPQSAVDAAVARALE